MMLPYTFDGAVDLEDRPYEAETTPNSTPSTPKRATSELPFIYQKICVPAFNDLIERPRIADFLERSTEQFRANLISGRAATGKTYAAADLAARYGQVAWYSVDSTDINWQVFSNYLTAAIAPKVKFTGDDNNVGDIASYLNALFAAAAKSVKKGNLLIVLDDLQHVFDASWFPEFFQLLLSSTLPNTHVLMLCRSKPPLPLWRMRSKHMLNVVDEKMLAFDEEETADLCRKFGLPENVSHRVPANAFGRAGKVAEFLQREPAGDYYEEETASPLFLANTDPFVP